eukprot:Filipodium_phascolosomae@DN2542_c0_g1_i1.p1
MYHSRPTRLRPPFEDLQTLAAETNRFPEEPNPHYLTQLRSQWWLEGPPRLPPFDPSDEAEFDEWVDKAALIICEYDVCLQLFQRLWNYSCAADSRYTVPLKTEVNGATHEDLVNRVAKRLFRGDQLYVQQLEDELLFGKRQETASETHRWIRQQCAKYVRLCTRHDRPLSVSNSRLVETVLLSLPIEVEREVRRKGKCMTAQEVLDRSLEEVEPDRLKQYLQDRADRIACSSCNEFGHLRSQCPHRQDECANCGRRGHIQQACWREATDASKKGKRRQRKKAPGPTEDQNQKDFAVWQQNKEPEVTNFFVD